MKEYKPILVFYFKENFSRDEWQGVCHEIEKVKERTGYEVISFQGCDTTKAEIISVDKATVAEDIQKYIDLNSNTKNEIGENFIPDLDVTTYLEKEA